MFTTGFASVRNPIPIPNTGHHSKRLCHKNLQVKTGDLSSGKSPSAFCISCSSLRIMLATAAVTATMFSIVAAVDAADALAIGNQQQQQQQQQEQETADSSETLSNIPQTLSGSECSSSDDVSGKNDCKKPRIQRPKSRKAEICTVKCVNTCIRGGQGSPGEGPLNIRRPLVVFKQGFRSRQYCLIECSDICNLIGDGDDGP